MKRLMALALACTGAALAVLAPSPAFAQSHPGHNPEAKCGWQADLVPTFLPGHTQVLDIGTSFRVSAVFRSLVGVEKWRIVVLPGYEFGYAYAWDEGVPLESHVSKSYSRVSLYCVTKTTDCCLPTRWVTPTVNCLLRARAAIRNAPGDAQAMGDVLVLGRNTKVTCIASPAATCDEDDDGLDLGVEVPGPFGIKVKLGGVLHFGGSSESIDEKAGVTLGATQNAPDEEYAILTDLSLDVTADGAPWDTGEAEANVSRCSVAIDTAVRCDHCGASMRDVKVFDASFHGVTETTTGDDSGRNL